MLVIAVIGAIVGLREQCLEDGQHLLLRGLHLVDVVSEHEVLVTLAPASAPVPVAVHLLRLEDRRAFALRHGVAKDGDGAALRQLVGFVAELESVVVHHRDAPQLLIAESVVELGEAGRLAVPKEASLELDLAHLDELVVDMAASWTAGALLALGEEVELLKEEVAEQAVAEVAILIEKCLPEHPTSAGVVEHGR